MKLESAKLLAGLGAIVFGCGALEALATVAIGVVEALPHGLDSLDGIGLRHYEESRSVISAVLAAGLAFLAVGKTKVVRGTGLCGRAAGIAVAAAILSVVLLAAFPALGNGLACLAPAVSGVAAMVAGGMVVWQSHALRNVGRSHGAGNRLGRPPFAAWFPLSNAWSGRPGPRRDSGGVGRNRYSSRPKGEVESAFFSSTNRAQSSKHARPIEI